MAVNDMCEVVPPEHDVSVRNSKLMLAQQGQQSCASDDATANAVELFVVGKGVEAHMLSRLPAKARKQIKDSLDSCCFRVTSD